MNHDPTVSVIVPTYNRNRILRRALDAFCVQTYPLRQVEVIVVADGCTDGTVEALRHYEAPFALHVIEQPNQGPAAARNHGAAQARGRWLIFLDDDIESAPSLVEAHVQAHASQPDQVVIGYLPPAIQEPVDFFHAELRGWWEAMEIPGRPGRRADGTPSPRVVSIHATGPLLGTLVTPESQVARPGLRLAGGR